MPSRPAVTFAVACDFANVTAEGKLNLLGLFSEVYIKPGSLPVSLPSVFIAFGLDFPNSDVGRKVPMELILRSPSNEQLANYEAEAVLEPPKAPGTPIGIQQLMGLANFEIRETGTYLFVITVDGDEIAKVPLRAYFRS